MNADLEASLPPPPPLAGDAFAPSYEVVPRPEYDPENLAVAAATQMLSAEKLAMLEQALGDREASSRRSAVLQAQGRDRAAKLLMLTDHVLARRAPQMDDDDLIKWRRDLAKDAGVTPTDSALPTSPFSLNIHMGGGPSQPAAQVVDMSAPGAPTADATALGIPMFAGNPLKSSSEQP